ncbi:MAG: TlpA family protein disulfide reductase [Bacteroidia bacterium]
MRRLLLFFALAFAAFANAQEPTCTLEGYAPGRAGKVVGVYAYNDLITYTEDKLAEGIVDDSGKFTLSFPNYQTRYIFVRCEKLIGFFFAQPNRTTRAEMPGRDPDVMVNPDVEYEVSLTIFSNDSTDMNVLAIDFNSHFQKFWTANYDKFLRKESIHVLDTFHISMKKKYAWVKNPYFMPWMDYSLASMEDATFHPEKKMANKYLIGHPLFYTNNEYMNFFNNFFQDYLYSWSMRKEGEDIRPAINDRGSYEALMDALKDLRWLSNDTIRELVMLKGLFELYNNPTYNPRNILSITEQTAAKSKIAEHRTIARNILSLYTGLRAGSKAPPISGTDRKGELINPLELYKGKYIYVFFFATWNTNSTAELRYMADLQKKYGKKINFVAISLDEDTVAYKNFLKQNPKYNWLMLHYDYNAKMKADYQLFAVPAGFVIDPDGQLYISPADHPSGILELQIWKIVNPRDPLPIKPGER